MTRAALTTAILAATLAIAVGVSALILAIATAASGHAQVTMQPGGGVSCPGAYYAQRLDGRMMIMCPPPPVTKQQADEYGRQWLKAHDDEAARMAALAAKEKATERASILKTCTNPAPSINQAWCANEIARLSPDR